VHGEYAAADKEMTELAQRVDSLDGKELYRLARLQEDLDGLPAAYDTFGRLAEALPDNAAAQFHWGRAQFEPAFASAETAFYKAMELDIELVPDISKWLKSGYERENRPADFARFEPYAARFDELRQRANAERDVVKLEDELVAPQLTDAQRAALHRHVELHPEMRKVYLVEKKTTTFQRHRVFLVVFDVNTMHDNVEIKEERWLARVADSFAMTLPFLNNPFAIIVTKKSTWGARLRDLEGALIYERQVSGGARTWSFIKAAYGLLVLAILVVAVGYMLYGWLTS
jgi:hypothetical protein